MTLEEHQAAFAHDVGKLLTYIFNSGYNCTLGEAFRTKEQAELYAKQGKGIVNSLHCKKLAIDLNLFDLKGNYLQDYTSYEEFGKFFESLDPINRWGGRFHRVDLDHFERNYESDTK